MLLLTAVWFQFNANINCVEQEPNYHDPFFLVESVCVAWFTVEFLLRLVSCPSKRGFCRDVMNIFDVLAILPFFVTLITMQVRIYLLQVRIHL
jgi:Ion transport protein